MRIVAIVCGGIFVLCLVAFPTIEYVGGRVCEPLGFPLFFGILPAQVVPFGIGVLAAVILLTAVVASFIVRQDRLWTIGALALVLAATMAFLFSAPHLPGFLHGLRDRFVAKVGYPKMREFARAVSQEGFPLDSDRCLQKPGSVGYPTSVERQKQWDELARRYPFLHWVHGDGTVIARGGCVELHWGSPLTGHWGFQVSLDGTFEAVEENRGRILKAADDIRFVNYFD
jgi:hypothetical protein